MVSCLSGEPRSGQTLTTTSDAVVSGAHGARQNAVAGGEEAIYPWPDGSARRHQRRLQVNPGEADEIETAS